MVLFIAFKCDGCGVEAFGKGRAVPEGWQGFRWTQGVITPPGTTPLPSGKYECCSVACIEKLGVTPPKAAEGAKL